MHLAGRNDFCPCGSGLKYKKCCLASGTYFVKPLDPSEFDEVYEELCAKIETNDLIGAEKEAQRLHHFYPDDPRANFICGVLNLKKKLYEPAIFSFENAIELDPMFPEAYLYLGVVYSGAEKILQSVDCLKKVIEMEGEGSELGNTAQTILDVMEKSIETDTGQPFENYLKATALFDKGFEDLNAHHYHDAIALFQKVLEMDPKHIQAYTPMGIAYSALGEQKIALEYLDKALLINPNYEPARHIREIIAKRQEGEQYLDAIKKIDNEQVKAELENQPILKI
jgi:tetratricopeptide (TPR) repeat protein